MFICLRLQNQLWQTICTSPNIIASMRNLFFTKVHILSSDLAWSNHVFPGLHYFNYTMTIQKSILNQNLEHKQSQWNKWKNNFISNENRVGAQLFLAINKVKIHSSGFDTVQNVRTLAIKHFLCPIRIVMLSCKTRHWHSRSFVRFSQLSVHSPDEWWIWFKMIWETDAHPSWEY